MKNVAIGVMSILLIIVSGCQMRGLSGNEVMASMLEANQTAISYYMETDYQGNDGDPFTMKEWRMADGKFRTEMYEGEKLVYVSLYSDIGHVLLDYEEEQLITYDSPETASYLTQTPRESMMQMLEAMHDHYDIKVKEEAKLLDREVFVLELSSKQSDNDQMELWIDKENWVLLKTDFVFDEEWMTSEAAAFDINPKMEESLFLIDDTIDFEPVSLDDLVSNEQVDLEEAKEKTGFDILTPTQEYHFHEATMYPRPEDEMGVTLTYRDAEGRHLFSYEVFKRDEPLAAVFGNEEELTVRESPGLLIWDHTLKMISWQEGDVLYRFNPENDLITKEKALQIVEGLR
ncbi:hypothetical protein M3689_08095 [Alkalihalophilus marmarensis]|uniref:MucB/RseB N-terminal domain-containing protein n=1 Tax=Alkalihalophilus marmarensis DSM 21297 TaxID=1188261 RepID=U6SUN5_9BACI|nr:sigma-E factor regulatory protein RseB domain-containing protein [Alkalihalophilus marmarensis]ERN55102.1 hypothetical protein A33I_03945 [Alkalihalophilus marmarensis DSM 21297]MCM3489257.1 hypothetical protein [Alkalihalophilus marmarensis]